MNWADFYLDLFPGGFRLERAGVSGRHARTCTCRISHLHHGLHVPHACGARRAAAELPWFNFGTMAAFLAWFGGTGYLLERYYAVWYVLALGVAVLSGMGAAAVVFWFLAKVLMAQEAPLDPADYDMVGVLGKLSISDPRRRNRRDDLFAGGHAPRRRRAQRGWRGHPQRRGSGGDALRERHCVRAPVGRPRGRAVSVASSGPRRGVDNLWTTNVRDRRC